MAAPPDDEAIFPVFIEAEVRGTARGGRLFNADHNALLVA
jgi:hypothetical protein